MKSLRSAAAFAAAFLFLCSCESGIGTGVGNPPTSTTTGTKVAAAVTSLFSSGGSDAANVLKSVKVRVAELEPTTCTGTGSSCLCDNILAGESQTPEGITNSPFGDPGTYGSSARQVTLASEDFCTEPDGTENPEAGPDGSGRYAVFEMIADVEAVCTGSSDAATFSMKIGSAGVTRNVDLADGESTYQSQVYGTFLLAEGDGESIAYDCTIFIMDDSTAEFVDCSDANGNSVTQESEVTCEFPGSD